MRIHLADVQSADPIRVLHLEDNEDDALLALAQLRRAGLKLVASRVDTRDAFLRALEEFKPDLVLSDYSLPAFDGTQALALVRERHPEVPVVMLSGVLGDERSIELLKAGAADYVLKGNLVRLGPAVSGALERERERRTREQAEEAVRVSESRFRKLIENISDLVLVMDAEGRITYASPSALPITGFEPAELVGQSHVELTHPDDRDRMKAALATIAAEPAAFENLEVRLRVKDGTWRTTETAVRNLLPLPGMDGIVATIHDISGRKAAERAIRESEGKFRAIFDQTADGIAAFDPDTRAIQFANAAMDRLLGYGPGESIGIVVEAISPRRSIRSNLHEFDRAAAGASNAVQDIPLRRKDGLDVYVDITGGLVEIDGRTCLLATFRDATQRRAGERRLQSLIRALKTLSAGNIALVRASEEGALLQDMVRIVCGVGEHPAALIAYAVEDERQSVEVKACAGIDPDDAARLDESWGDNERGQSGTGRAIREGKTQLVSAATAGQACVPWPAREEDPKIGATLSLPIRLAPTDPPFGALIVGAKGQEEFDAAEVKLLEELAGDLGYGISNLRSAIERRHGATQLRRSLEGTIEAIASTMESRDPYTAGHQRRVAAVATAIATELGLPAHTVEGIHFGSLIHDVGKIQVPAEILAKPGRLSRPEFELIKTHPAGGYEIVKGIEFPWPVALMVFQHHERLDGSGYPQGLKGDQIIREAQILAVADVVEAMSSHRPYRAGKGIEAALVEIGAGRGTAYAADVVDACLNLFRVKGFQIPD